MKRLLVPAAVLLVRAALGAPAPYRAAAGGSPPGELAPEIREALAPRGVRVVDSRGFRFCELWLREARFESGSFEEALRQDAIPEGALLGVIEYQAPSADRHGRGFARGLYVLRSMGSDSVALIPASEDRSLDPPEQIATLSRGVLRWTPSAGSAVPRFEMNARGEWILHVGVGEVAVALLVAGVASR